MRANPTCRYLALFVLITAGVTDASLVAAVDSKPLTVLRQALAVACTATNATLDEMAHTMTGAAGVDESTIEFRDNVIGWRRRLVLDNGAEVKVERIAPAGRLRRLGAQYSAPSPHGKRPLLTALAGPRCQIRFGRRLVYEDGSVAPIALEHLDGKLAPTGRREPLNPPVPAGRDPGGVLVAIVDAGVNYLLPEIDMRLARDRDGKILGYDYWDLDDRPFDANPARSPFFPQRHGTRTASLLIREAPMIRLVPYRYPRPDMKRMTDLVHDAARKGIRIINLSMGSNKLDEWQAFVAAARARPEILFVVSAGNNGRDIDAQPVYPAALHLDNIVTVTSSETT
ncbi:MAG: S8/S53 family peptidase, partial [Acidiferrobacterales bacterium]